MRTFGACGGGGMRTHPVHPPPPPWLRAWNMTYNERLIKLNLLPLERRREISDLLLFFRSRNGLVSTEVSNYLRTFQPRHRTRNYDPNIIYPMTLILENISLVRCAQS